MLQLPKQTAIWSLTLAWGICRLHLKSSLSFCSTRQCRTCPWPAATCCIYVSSRLSLAVTIAPTAAARAGGTPAAAAAAAVVAAAAAAAA